MANDVQAHEPLETLPHRSTTVVVPWLAIYASTAALFLLVFAGGVGVYRLLWGSPSNTSAGLFWVLLIAGVFLHECLHGLGFVLGGARIRDVRLGVRLSWGGAYATTATPLPLCSYRVAVVLPLVVLGLAPLFIGLAGGWYLVTKLGAIFVSVAGGDVAILFALRGTPSGAMIIDRSDCPGFHVLP